jgi:hypothetical protein
MPTYPALLRDINGTLIPQYFGADGQWHPAEGNESGMEVQVIGSALPAGAATSANQASEITALNALLTLLGTTGIALPTGGSTAANQSSAITLITALQTILTAIRDTSGIKKITDQLPAGTNNIGDVDIATMPSIPAGANVIGGVTIADGSSTALGAKADAAVTDYTATASQIGILKGLLKQLQGSGAGRQPVNVQDTTGTAFLTAANPGYVGIGKTFSALPSATPIYFISDTAGQLLYVTEFSAAGYVTGQKSIGTTGIEIYGGASNRLANRYLMKVTSSIKNTGIVYMINSGGSTSTGDAMLPGDVFLIDFTL